MKITPFTVQILTNGLAIGLSRSADSMSPAIAFFYPTNVGKMKHSDHQLSVSNHPGELLAQGKALGCISYLQIEVQRCRGAEVQRCRGAEVQRCRGRKDRLFTKLRCTQALYQAGQFADAAIALQEAAAIYEIEKNTLKQALVLSNLSLGYQQLGQWQAANLAMSQSLEILGQFNLTYQRISRIKAQMLEIYADRQLQQGKPETALSI